MNLFLLCAENCSRLESQFHQRVTALLANQQTALKTYTERIEQEGRVALNMRPMTLLDFFASERYLTIHQWAEQRSRKSSKSEEAILREKLEDWYEKRLAFDAFFENGKEFKYGALTIGGLGAEAYGEYCVVLENAPLDADLQVGYLRGDSLTTFVTDALAVDEPKLREQCAKHSHKHFLAGPKYQPRILQAAEEHWAIITCNRDDFIEAILLGNLLPSHIATVRLSETLHDLYFSYAYEEFRERLEEVDRYRVETFVRIMEYMEALGLGWELVEDD